ncbi:MAG: sulfurtransferase [Chromatiales bacterium]|jgi:thiosulfate/3-mercaptopyruvate sulfurtransferase
METLVSTAWLEEHLADPDLVVLDCSVVTVQHEDGGFHNESGLAQYQQSHIPGAGFADLKGDLCDSASDIEFAIPEPAAFCQAMERLGVGNDSFVVLYDGSLSAWAARVWWMLRWIGFDRAAILDGGFSAWTGEGRPLSSGLAAPVHAQLTMALRPGLVADRDEVMAAITDDDVVLVDTLPAVYYCGEEVMYARPGHITGAINLCGTDYLDDSGHNKALGEVADMLDLDRNRRVITYCGGGILASLNAFVMTRLGYRDVAVYTASLQEWASDPANPMSVCG